MEKTINFTLITGHIIPVNIKNNTSVLEIKNILHETQLSHFPIETMKFICNGTALNNTDIIPLDVSLIALAIIPIECHDH